MKRALWSCLLLESSLVNSSYYDVQLVSVFLDMSLNLLMPWH